MSIIYFGNAIKSLNPDAEFTCPTNESDFDKTIWHNNTTPISKEDIKTEQVRLQDIEDTK